VRRRALLALLGAPAWHAARAGAIEPRALVFPADFGAHPALRTEWWYITGALDAGTERCGFQITFFRSRTDVARDHPSRFAARQLVFAHAAVTDLQQRRLRHDQAVARAGFGIAEAASGDTRLVLRDWTLARDGPAASSRYRARAQSRSAGFAFDLVLEQTQPLLLQGADGYSRKGPLPAQASHYYSQPQLKVEGRLALDGRERRASGRAWLDHEWSEALLADEAVGWDWVGMNLDDGSALTAFRLRRADGSAFWAGGSFRRAGEPARDFAPDAVRFTPLAHWQSAATGARYPVAWRIDTPAGTWQVRALVDAQELDSRASTGSVYWEGISELLDAGARRAGVGYLEMTGYAGRLRLS